MHLPRRRAIGGEPHEATMDDPGPILRGAWYADPFTLAGERWWDGTKWTDRVRELAGSELEQARPPDPGKARSADAHTGGARPQDKRSPQDRRTDSAPDVELTAGDELTVVPSDRRRYGYYRVLTGDFRIGSLRLGGRNVLARMVWAESAWCLKKRHGLGWELVIESSDGRDVGRYSRRHWLPGGTIALTNGTQVDLRRSLSRRWKLRASHTKEQLVDIHVAGAPSAQKVSVAVRSLPAGNTDWTVIVLTSCAVLMLDRGTGTVTLSSAQ